MVRATSPSAQEEEGLFRVLLRKWTVDSVVFGDRVSGDILGSATTPGGQFKRLRAWPLQSPGSASGPAYFPIDSLGRRGKAWLAQAGFNSS